MIIKNNLNSNFNNFVLYRFKYNPNIETITATVKNDLIIYHYDNVVYEILDRSLHNDNHNRMQVLDKIPNHIFKELEGYILPDEKFYIFGEIIKIDTHPKNDKLKVLQVNNDKEYQIITNRDDVKLNKKYWFSIEGAILADGSQIANTKVNGISSQGMIMSQNSFYGNNISELCTSENDFDLMKKGF